MKPGWYELHLQIRRELAAEAGEAARAADLNLSAWVRAAIREKLERERVPPGSFPIPDENVLRRAAMLARSKHGA